MDIHLGIELVSPEKVIYKGIAQSVTVRTVECGNVGFLPGRASFLGVLDVWSVDVVRSKNERDVFAVHRGFVQMHDNMVTILSDVSEAAADIDVDRAERARSRALSALTANPENAEASAALKRAELRLRVASGAKMTYSAAS